MSGLKVHTAWSTSAVTTAEAKTHMRIDSSFTDDDTYIGNLVTASQNMVEQITGRAITHQTLQLFLDILPYYNDSKIYPEGFFTAPDLNQKLNYISLPKPTLSSVTHFKYYDDEDSATTFASSNYYVDTAHEPGRIVLREGKTFPSASDLRVANCYEIQYVAGYGSSASDVPENIKTALKQLVAHWYDNRELVTNVSVNKIPVTVNALLLNYKITKFNTPLGA